MHDMQTIVTDVYGVCQSVSLSLSRGSTRLHCAKTAEQIKMLFGVNTFEGPRNIVLDGGPDPPQRGGFDAAFAKILWPLVQESRCTKNRIANFAQLKVTH